MATILVTGASSGIGRATCLLLAAGGHTVLAAARNQEALTQLAADAGARHPGSLRPMTLDIRSETSRRELVAGIAQDGLDVDVLVNCAGMAVSGPLLEIRGEQARELFDTNVLGLLALTQQVAKTMVARGSGRVVNVSSTAGRFVGPFAAAYSASKFALEALSDGLRMELRPLGVDVVVVEPGAVRTGFAERSMEQAHIDPAGAYAPLIPRLPTLLERSKTGATSPEKIADVIVRAALTTRPRTRYVAPLPARLVVRVMTLLPARVKDRALGRASYFHELSPSR
ncbi:MAG: SDR family oxidoreductase [Dermatophilaceae bacterium]